MTSESHSFNVELAAEIGIELAILVHHFQHWINVNKRNGTNYIDGRTWTYQTRKYISGTFPYWSEDQIRRYTDKLVDLGILIKGNYNKSPIDKTIWYAFKNEEIFTIGKSANSTGKFARPIPDTKNTDTKKNPPPTSSKKIAQEKPKKKGGGFFLIDDCLKDLDISEDDKIRLSKMLTDKDRLKRAVDRATTPGFIPDDLVAVIFGNYKADHPVPKSEDEVVSENKAFYGQINKILTQMFYDPKSTRFEPSNKYLEFIPGGQCVSECFEWIDKHFKSKVKKYFINKNMWNDACEECMP